jgi:hypothetical protein
VQGAHAGKAPDVFAAQPVHARRSAAIASGGGHSSGAHEAAEGLVNFGHAGNLVDAAKCGFTSKVGVFREAGALDGVNLGERWAYDHGVAHAAAEQIDAFGKTGAKDQK